MKIPEESFLLLQTACQKLFDKKSYNILTLDVRGVCSITDYFIIAEGNVARHVQSLVGNLYDELASRGRKPYHIEGQDSGDWIVMDYGDLIIHVMTSEMREKYALEQIWKEGAVVDIRFS